MGGKFLEDFRLVNDRFAIEQMISIELDDTTCKRQQFNRLGFIECRCQSSGDFIEDLDRHTVEHPQRRLIVWLDFAIPNKRGEQLGEFRQLLSKLASGDVAKITLNANSQSFRRRASALTRKDFDAYLKNSESPTHKDFQTYISSAISTVNGTTPGVPERLLTLSDSEYETVCIENLKEQLGEYVPTGGISPEHLKTETFAALLAEAVRIAALKGAESSKLQVLPLGAFRYRDGDHQMLTVTTIVANDDLEKAIRGDHVFAEWPFRANDWNTVIEVSVPDMSAKERHHIEGLISSQHTATTIHAEIPFRFDKRDETSLSLLREYLRHYRRYPTFVRVQ